MSDSPTNEPGTLSDSQTKTSREVSDTLTDSQAQPAPELMKALEMVDRLQQANQQLAGQLGFTQAKLQEAERTVALLMAPKDGPAPEPPAEPERRPWWKRIFT